VVLELIEKHTSQVDIGVSTSSGDVWKDIFNKDWLIELVCVRSISEMESSVIRELLSISRKSNDDRTWYINWGGVDDEVSVSC
jgi:hypothetical protein